jgi:hypothetical protein
LGPRRAVVSPHPGERAPSHGLLAAIWTLSSLVMRRLRDPRGDGSIWWPSMSSFYQKEKSRKIAAGCFGENPPEDG